MVQGIKIFIKDMVARGIPIRHQTAHAVGTDQVDPGPHRRRLSSRQTSSQCRATEHPPSGLTSTAILVPNPFDLIFSLIAFDSVRLFFETNKFLTSPAFGFVRLSGQGENENYKF